MEFAYQCRRKPQVLLLFAKPGHEVNVFALLSHFSEALFSLLTMYLVLVWIILLKFSVAENKLFSHVIKFAVSLYLIKFFFCLRNRDMK